MWTREGDPNLYFQLPNGMAARITREEWEHALRLACDCLKCRRRDDRMFDTPILGGKHYAA